MQDMIWYIMETLPNDRMSNLNFDLINSTWSSSIMFLLQAMTSAEIDAEMVCPLKTPSFLPGTHQYYPKRHSLIEGMSKCKIKREEAQAKFSITMLNDHMMKSTLTDLRLMRQWGQQRSSTAISRIMRQLAASCPKDSIIFAAEATAITLALKYYRHMDHVQHDAVVYSDPMSWQRHLCPILPSHCGIEGNEIVDQLAKATLWPWHRPAENYSLCRFDATGKLVRPTESSNQVGCIYTW